VHLFALFLPKRLTLGKKGRIIYGMLSKKAIKIITKKFAQRLDIATER